MTNLLDHAPTTPTSTDDRTSRARTSDRRSDEACSLSWPWRILLAALAAAAGAIHLAMVPSHWTESPIEGLGFALSGWLQVAVAGLIIGGPRRRWLHLAIAMNVVLIATWAASRLWGLPIGAHAGHPEQVSAVDLACVALEAAFVVGCLLALARPRIGATWSASTLVAASILPVTIVVLTTAVLASPSVHDHAQGSHGEDTSATGPADGHDHAHDTADATDVAAGDATGQAGASAAASGAHVHGDGGNADEQAELQPDVPLDAATQKLVGEQLVIAREAALAYPTVADAKAAGMTDAGGTGPGFGAHYIALRAQQGVNPDGTINAAYPNSYIYAGITDDSPITGVMYTSMGGEAPEGFAGPNDHWHRHSNVCTKFEGGRIKVPFRTDSDVTKEMCDGVGGRFMETTVWMVHAWVVPGWESPKGVFSHDNPNVHCPDGTDDADAVGACVVQQV